jgi:hypothetical protein
VLVVCIQVNVLFDVVPQPVIVLDIESRCRCGAPLAVLVARFSSPAGLADYEEPPELADDPPTISNSRSTSASATQYTAPTPSPRSPTHPNPDRRLRAGIAMAYRKTSGGYTTEQKPTGVAF